MNARKLFPKGIRVCLSGKGKALGGQLKNPDGHGVVVGYSQQTCVRVKWDAFKTVDVWDKSFLDYVQNVPITEAVK